MLLNVVFVEKEVADVEASTVTFNTCLCVCLCMFVRARVSECLCV